jgi:succinoglycan biosynthesis transport protein ExoP
MSSELLPQRSAARAPVWPKPPSSIPPIRPEADDVGVPWWRYAEALRRFKWLVLIVSALGIAGGFVATRLIPAVYEVRATVRVADSKDNGAASRGPIRAQPVVSPTAWVELLRSYAITERVVRRLNLFIVPESRADSVVFRGLGVSGDVRPGRYKLVVNSNGYELTTGKDVVLERGAIGDSVGGSIGLVWQPAASLLKEKRTIAFVVKTPREAAVDMVSQSASALPEESNFLRVSLVGQDAKLAAATLNAWIEQFVDEARLLKRRNLTELVGVLKDQLALSEQHLKSAEAELEGFRVKTITLPTEGTAIASGIAQTRDPVFNDFFTKRLQAETIRRDREAVERILADGRAGASIPDALMSVPGIVQSSEELRTTLNELYTKRATLRTYRQTYTDEYPTVRALAQDVSDLEKITIPGIALAVASQLSRRQADLDSTVAGTSRELRNIPARTIEEMRLHRDVNVAENLYTTLQSRYEEARLAEASAVPDVSVLDAAIAPLRPTANMASRLLLMASLGSIALALALAILLDRLDSRFRYPKQATHELGLEIIGFIPTLHQSRKGTTDLASASQLVEACRQIRMHVQHALPTPSIVTITSPGPGEGKSLTATNVALAFAAEGRRTLLIDGDIRRGALHQVFGRTPSPGLLDCLSGPIELVEAIRQTKGNDKLWFLPRGARRKASPELLASSRLPELLAQLSTHFDAIVVDSAPLGAGVDAYALGVACGSVIVVLRAGQTDRHMADAKLRLIERLPIAVLGCVVNDVRPTGVYEYYSYVSGYEAIGEPVVVTG